MPMCVRPVQVKHAFNASGWVQRLWRTSTTRSTYTMATSSKVHLSPSQQPVFYVPGISAEAAEMTSELLQRNHEKHHIFFNYAGFHVRRLQRSVTHDC